MPREVSGFLSTQPAVRPLCRLSSTHCLCDQNPVLIRSQVGNGAARTRAMEHTGFQHQALIYESAEDYLAGTAPYLRAGLEAGQPVLVAVGPDQTELLRDE